MKVLSVDPNDPRQDRINEAAEALRSGEIVALPTETFYGLAADPFNPDAVLRVNRLKQKADDSPLLLLLADVGQAELVSADLPVAFWKLAERFWPGPLTMVVPAAPTLPVDVSGRRGTVAVRLPGMPLPRRLAASLGRPITGVSANLHARAPNRIARDVVAQFPTGLDIILDGGPSPGGQPSTILDVTGSQPTILRHGLLPALALEPFLSDLEKGPL